MNTKDQLSGSIDLKALLDGTAPPSGPAAPPWRGASVADDAGVRCTLIGSPRFDHAPAGASPAMSALALWRQRGPQLPRYLHGDYALAIQDGPGRRVFLAVDRFATQTLCYRLEAAGLAFSDRADGLAARDARLDPQAIFEYLFFHMIPAPRTVFRDVLRLPAAHSLLVDAKGATLERHWPLNFPVDPGPDFPKARARMIEILEESVRAAMPQGRRVGAFLSGGTDSSTVVGMMKRVTGQPTKAYSIGFEASGYDEMEYARIAARHFGAEHHEYYVTQKDLLDSIPAVARHYDQPFGNSSALPAYYCARMARDDGCDLLLAGDGGDELFGGNSRYAMQVFLDHYRHVPAGLRRVVEPWCGDDSLLRRIPGLRQATGYVRHARVPMPRRMQGMNLLMELGLQNVFEPDFLAQVSPDTPEAHMEATWQACQDPSVLNRMLAYDWVYTLADSDLPKVRGAVAMAGVEVGYPLLADRLVDFSMTLPQHWKLRRFRLRWFFKEALRGFLPDAIITKKKHGFGLPHGRWMTTDPALKSLARQSLEGLVGRRMIRGAFVDELVDRLLPVHPGYYGEMIWILMMLEHWLQAHPGAEL